MTTVVTVVSVDRHLLERYHVLVTRVRWFYRYLWTYAIFAAMLTAFLMGAQAIKPFGVAMVFLSAVAGYCIGLLIRVAVRHDFERFAECNPRVVQQYDASLPPWPWPFNKEKR